MNSDPTAGRTGGAHGGFTLDELELVDAPACMSLDGLTQLAATVLAAPVALISIVEKDWDRQFFTSQVGLPDPWAAYRQTPLSHSFCQHVVADGAPLIVMDSRENDRVKDNLAIPDLNVIAYLGVPVRGPDHVPLGALCVIDGEPRDWSDRDVSILSKLADCVSREIQLRAALLTARKLKTALQAATKAAAATN